MLLVRMHHQRWRSPHKAGHPQKFRMAPLAVPDPPRAHRPPPTPRPARLPTPDLPEIEEEKFFRLEGHALRFFPEGVVCSLGG